MKGCHLDAGILNIHNILSYCSGGLNIHSVQPLSPDDFILTILLSLK